MHGLTILKVRIDAGCFCADFVLISLGLTTNMLFAFRHQKQINLDGTSEAAPTLVGHIHLDKV